MWQDIRPTFIMFSLSHLAAIGAIMIGIMGMAIWSKKKGQCKTSYFEKIFALSLISVEWLYYIWMYKTGEWAMSYSLPLELCSISLYAAILLLWTGDRRLYPFVLFAGIGGALQAIITPDLEVGFPHFRYFQFFYVHGGIIFTALYFTWIKKERPILRQVFKTLIALNVIAFFVYFVNHLVDGNYMFLNAKPSMGSLLDYLGPYPYYILSLEFVALLTFLMLWFVFKERRTPTDY